MLSSSRCRAFWNINTGKTLCVLTLAFFFLVAQLWPWQSFLHKSFVWLSCHLGVSVVNKGPMLAQCREGLSTPQILTVNQDEGKQGESMVISVSPSLPLAPPPCFYVFHSTTCACQCPAGKLLLPGFFAGTSLAGSRVHYVFNGPGFLMAFSLNIQSTPKIKKDMTQCWEFTLVTDKGQICPWGGIEKRSDTDPSIGLNALR